MSPSPGRSTANAGVPNQGLATLLVMIAVLAIIILFCCFAAPGIRDICRKLCRCKIDDPDREPGKHLIPLSLYSFSAYFIEENVTGSSDARVEWRELALPFWLLFKGLLYFGK